MRTKSLTLLAVLLSMFACGVASSQDSGEPTAPSPTWIDSGNLVVMVSDSRDVIAAYSEPTAKIARVELETPLPADENPVAYGGVAMVRNEDTVYAIGADKAVWARLVLPSSDFKVDGNSRRILLWNANKIFIFGSHATSWTGFRFGNGRVLDDDDIPGRITTR